MYVCMTGVTVSMAVLTFKFLLQSHNHVVPGYKWKYDTTYADKGEYAPEVEQQFMIKASDLAANIRECFVFMYA